MNGDPTEAKIQAAWPKYDITDLDMTLRAGQKPVYVAASTARASKDFQEGVRLGALQVEWVQRCRVSKPKQPPPPANRRIRPEPRKPAKAEAAVDEEALADRIAAKLDKKQQQRDAERDAKNAEFQAEVLRKVKEASAQGQSITPEMLQAMLTGAVKEAVENAPVKVVEGGGGGTVRSGRDEGGHTPFIPSQIVREDVKTSITAKESSTDATQTDEARRKLREKRRKAKNND